MIQDFNPPAWPEPISLIDVTGVNGETGVARIAGVKAGSKITFEWRDWPDGTKPGSIDPSHKGPCAVYMKKVDDSSASNNAAGDGWFKIMEDGYDSTAKQWCTEKLIPNNGHLQATVPQDLAPGYYLMRPELLALHATQATPPDPQFYVGCAQVFLTSDGSTTPKDHVSIPGYVTMQTPAMTYNIYATPLKLPFPDFGPPLYNPGSSKRSLVERDTTQTIGLKPSDCVMENGNWCAVMPPSYTDQNGCWDVSTPPSQNPVPARKTDRPQSSQNCWTQNTVCYQSAGPTGGKNCHNWENYCKKLQGQCAAGNYNGPPSAEDEIPAQLPALSGGVVAMTAPMEGSVPTASPAAASASGAVSAFPSDDPAPAPTLAIPVPSGTGAVTAGANASSSGSIDTCGSNGGQTCKAGMCCSSHGYTSHHHTSTQVHQWLTMN